MRLAPLVVIVLVGIASGAQAAAKPGKPGSGMTDAKCQATWITVSPNGAAISKDKFVPYTVDFTTLDTDNDGIISQRILWQGARAV